MEKEYVLSARLESISILAADYRLPGVPLGAITDSLDLAQHPPEGVSSPASSASREGLTFPRLVIILTRASQ
jgi:hypothetical protein